jgi:hypothetical protein
MINSAEGGETVMDFQTLAQLIGSLGFPIACCVYMFFSQAKEREQNAAQREADRLEHKSEMDKMTNALNNNTIVIQKLVDTLTAPAQDSRH